MSYLNFKKIIARLYTETEIEPNREINLQVCIFRKQPYLLNYNKLNNYSLHR